MRRRLLAVGCATILFGAGSAAASEEDGAGAARAVQQAILAKPGGAEQVLSLQDDPNVKSLLRDESVLRAVRSGDLGALAADPRVEELMKNPAVRSLAADLQR